MSGHSKWSNIKRKKEKTDSQRAKIFTKMGREISVAVKEGGPDVLANAKLRDVIAKAKANNVPNENIERIIKKAAGDSERNNFEDITYEGYGPGGVAILVKTLTDNRNRTAGDMRYYFDKYGGNLGTTGCVSFGFKIKGIIVIDLTNQSEEQLIDDALMSGADDFESYEGVFEVTCDPEKLTEVREYFEKKGINFLSCQVEYIPTNYITLSDPEQVSKMERLLEILEENDDVQTVWHNWQIDEN